MPVYTYECKKCSAKFTRTETVFDKALKRCPECYLGTVRRVPQRPTIIFKGSGWYATDHRTPSTHDRAPNRKNEEDEHSTDDKSKSRPQDS
jgi:putative FmdB family regulatory protein